MNAAPCGIKLAAMSGMTVTLAVRFTARSECKSSLHALPITRKRGNKGRLSSHAKEPKCLWATFNAILGRRRDRTGDSPILYRERFPDFIHYQGPWRAVVMKMMTP